MAPNGFMPPFLSLSLSLSLFLSPLLSFLTFRILLFFLPLLYSFLPSFLPFLLFPPFSSFSFFSFFLFPFFPSFFSFFVFLGVSTAPKIRRKRLSSNGVRAGDRKGGQEKGTGFPCRLLNRYSRVFTVAAALILTHSSTRAYIFKPWIILTFFSKWRGWTCSTWKKRSWSLISG